MITNSSGRLPSATITQGSSAEALPNGREVQTISQTVVTASESSNGEIPTNAVTSEAVLMPNGTTNPTMLRPHLRSYSASMPPLETFDESADGGGHYAIAGASLEEQQRPHVLITTSFSAEGHQQPQPHITRGRVPPPKALRKCVLINNDCKFSIQLPPETKSQLNKLP